MTKPTRKPRIEAIREVLSVCFTDRLISEIIDADPATAYIAELERQLADMRAVVDAKLHLLNFAPEEQPNGK